MIRSQRSAVAAASVPAGSGELELTLVLANGSMRCRADLGFAAHEMPLATWAEAVWEC